MLSALWLAALIVGADPPADAEANADDFRAPSSWSAMGKDLWYDKANKRLAMRSVVALREGSLEHLLCRRNTKEHEAVLATEASPKLIKAGLLLLGVAEGKPVQFDPKFSAPSGGKVKIEVEWIDNGKTKKALAKEWVKDIQDKPLTLDWVFAGSSFYTDPITQKQYFGADDGDLITVANFPTAILDLPIASSESDASRGFMANTEKIPPQGTRVTIYLSALGKPVSAPAASPKSKVEKTEKATAPAPARD